MANADLDQLLEEAYSLPDGKAKLLLFEEAARMAESQNDLDTCFDINKKVVKLGIFHGQHVNAFVAFSWRVAQCEKYPERFDVYDILWEYKWITYHMDLFADVSMEQLLKLYEDMKEKYQQEGASLRPYYSLKCRSMLRMGLFEEANEFYQKWINCSRDWLSDCNACDVDSQVDYLINVKNYDKAFKEVQPILSKRLSCGEIPHLTYSRLLLPLLELGKVEEALDYNQKGYKLVHKNRTFLPEISRHLTFLSIVDIEKALNVFEKHFQWAFETYATYDKFEFYITSWMMFCKFKKMGKSDLKIHLKDDYNIIDKYSLKTTDDLIGWFEKESRDIAHKFNTRNGGDYFNTIIEEKLKLVEFEI